MMGDKSFTGLLTQEETNYVPLSSVDGKACANCRWFMAMAQPSDCFIIANYPESILATGYCDRHEVAPQPEPAPDIVEAVTEAVVEAVEVITETVLMEHDSEQEWLVTPSENILSQLQKRLKSSLKPGQYVLKDRAGRRYMFMVTSNGYKDRDKEHVATKELENYVNSAWTKGDDAFMGQNDHYIWHVKDLGTISDLVFADVWSGFLVELWREKREPIAKAFYNFVERHSEIVWGASHGFSAVKDGDVFKHVHKFESSSLPLQAAANLLTISEVLPMTEKSKRDTFLNQLFEEEFGIKDAAALLKQGPEKLRQELTAHGIEAKALGEGSDALKQARGEAMKSTSELVLSMVEVQDQLDRELEAQKEAHAKELKALQDENAALKTEIKSVKEGLQGDIDALKKALNAPLQRPSESRSTQLSPEETEKARAAMPSEYDPFFGDMKVKKETVQ